METSTRVYQIDLFRFIAAVSVLLFHYLFRGHAADGLSVLDFSAVNNYFKYGYLGVNFFFIISGFAITLSLKNKSLTEFIKSRIVRLYPAYWFCVLLTFFIINSFGKPVFSASWKELFINLTMLNGFFGVKNIDGVYWSLLVEIKFYILIGLFLFITRIKTIKLDYLVYLWLGLTVLFIVAGHNYLMKILDEWLVFEWSPYFIAGIICYQIFEGGLTIKKLLLLFFSMIASIHFAFTEAELYAVHYKDAFSTYIVAMIIISFFLLMFLVSIKKLNFINSRIFLNLGLLTYPLYLIHQSIGYIIFNHLSEYLNKYLIFFITTLSVIVSSYFINKKIEVPLAALMKRLLNR